MPTTTTTAAAIEPVHNLLEDYARRGVFRAYSAAGVQDGVAVFRMIWHRNRPFELTVDCRQQTLRFANMLPGMPADSPMYRELKAFIKERHADQLPEHRRIDRRKAQARTYNRKGNVTLVLKIADGDYEYGARKLVHLTQEIFLTFLVEGINLEYMVETFDLDPDHL